METPEHREMEIVPVSPASEAFYAGAMRRITRCMIVLGIVFAAGAWLHFGWRVALGFACGAGIAYLNFHWLKRVVNALGERMSQPDQPRSGGGSIVRFMLRYFLMGLAAYAIFTVSRASLFGLLVGLFLPVAGIGCEAIYEAYAALIRGL